MKDSTPAEEDNNLILIYLNNMQLLSSIIQRISKVLVVLNDKRLTVAEKAIQEELILYAELESFLLYCLSKSIKGKSYCLNADDCLQLERLNIELNKLLRAFIKAARYSLNYLEQYFEHDFWLELTNNEFAKNLMQVGKNIPIKMR